MDRAKQKDGGKRQPQILTQIEYRSSKNTVTEEVNYLIYWRISHVATTGYKKRKPRSEREEELLNLVKEAIQVCKNMGQPITQKKLSDMVGLGTHALLSYAQVNALIAQTVGEDKQERQVRFFQERQDEMTQRVIVALQQLRGQNRKITKRAVDKLVHYSRVCLRYPKVRVLVEDAIQVQRTTNESNSD